MAAPESRFDRARSGAFVQEFTIEPKGAGLLNGLRFAVKDLIDLQGYATSCGNPTWRDTHPVAAANAVCVDQLLFAGAECAGKTVTDELAFGLSGENHFYGTPLNPRAPDRVPGGSSSGSASAVACGLVDFALGTDTGGSVRVPASNCGVFGMRPSSGGISVAGVNPLAPTFDTVGALASSYETLAKVISVLLVIDASAPAEVATVHFLQDAFEMSDDEVRRALRAPVEKIRTIFPGRTTETSLRDICKDAGGIDLPIWYDTYRQIQWAEIWSCLGSWVTASNPQFGPTTRMNFEHVKKFDRKTAVEAIHRREIYYRCLGRFLGPHDLICMPTAPSVAPKKGSLGADRTTGDYYPRSLALNSVAGIGRLPQVTLPLGQVEDGAPIGLSLLAAQGMDRFLLAVAGMLVS
jgi:amidase